MGSAAPAAFAPRPDDDDDVRWALSTALVQWNRGSRADAVLWLRRAGEAAETSGAPARATELRSFAATLAENLWSQPPDEIDVDVDLGARDRRAPLPPPPAAVRAAQERAQHMVPSVPPLAPREPDRQSIADLEPEREHFASAPEIVLEEEALDPSELEEILDYVGDDEAEISEPVQQPSSQRFGSGTGQFSDRLSSASVPPLSVEGMLPSRASDVDGFASESDLVVDRISDTESFDLRPSERARAAPEPRPPAVALPPDEEVEDFDDRVTMVPLSSEAEAVRAASARSAPPRVVEPFADSGSSPALQFPSDPPALQFPSDPPALQFPSDPPALQFSSEPPESEPTELLDGEEALLIDADLRESYHPESIDLGADWAPIDSERGPAPASAPEHARPSAEFDADDAFGTVADRESLDYTERAGSEASETEPFAEARPSGEELAPGSLSGEELLAAESLSDAELVSISSADLELGAESLPNAELIPVSAMGAELVTEAELVPVSLSEADLIPVSAEAEPRSARSFEQDIELESFSDAELIPVSESDTSLHSAGEAGELLTSTSEPPRESGGFAESLPPLEFPSEPPEAMSIGSLSATTAGLDESADQGREQSLEWDAGLDQAEPPGAAGSNAVSQAPPTVPVSEFVDGTLIDGVDLMTARGFEDLPEDVQLLLARIARVETLGEGEEVGLFGAAIITNGQVNVMPAFADEAGAVAVQSDVIFTRGSLEDSIALRVVAKVDGTRVAVWDPKPLADAIEACPWVHDELRLIADRFLALCGATLGPLGERLDESLRSAVFQRLEVRAFSPGEALTTEGEPLPGLFVIGGGRVEVMKGDQVLEEKGPGEFLFATAIMGGSKAPATARAGEQGALALFAPRSVAHELMISVPPLLEVLAG